LEGTAPGLHEVRHKKKRTRDVKKKRGERGRGSAEITQGADKRKTLLSPVKGGEKKKEKS